MKKKLSRTINQPKTVGDLINELKNNFHKDDDIVCLTVAIIPRENEIDIEKQSAVYDLYCTFQTLPNIQANRKQREIESLVMKKIK